MPLDRALRYQAEVSGAAESQTLKQRLIHTRQLSRDLAAPLSAEDQVVQAMDDASPTKWHLAHTTWFFEAFLFSPHVSGYKVFDDRFEYCFNSYYEAVGPRHPRPKRGLLTRPAVSEISEYRAYVDDQLIKLFDRFQDRLPEDIASIIELGINHEQQHQELLLTDILSAFAQGPLKPPYKAPEPKGFVTEAPCLEWIPFEGGIVEIGHDGRGFSYDNENPRHERLIQPFKLANRCVTNAEWLEFISDGGYETVGIWLSDGWARRQEEDWHAPLYWEKIDGEWHQMTLRGFQPIDPAAPVSHVSYYEADAFARWSRKRLPTEFEWEVASSELDLDGNTIGSGELRPRPANDGEGLLQMYGDVWEWTQSHYSPYPGFHPPEGAVGEYNGKFMCNQYVLKGGSCATPDGHIRPTYRNFFYPFQRWQFMGLRLASDL